MTNCSSDDCGCIETIGDNAAAILLDIEGTTSSISFVVDVMFPNVRENLASYLTDHHGSPDTRAAIDQIAIDADGEHASAESKFGDLADTNVQEQIARHVFSLMDDDVKSTGLKQLQGMIWKTGFQSGQMRAHLFDDVLPSMQRWIDQGKTIWIYSSGSVAAQLLFFGHTIHGDLLPMISGHWDTKIGHKRESDSYKRIAAEIADQIGVAPSEILFISDVVEELDAAASTEMQTALSLRPGNKPVGVDCGHRKISSFALV